jgi:HEAT repeat protein
MKRLVPFASAVFIVALLCAPLWADERKPEPKYEGKPLAYWVERLQKAESKQQRIDAASSIKAFGCDAAPAVPALMEMLDDRSESFRELVGEILYEMRPAASSAVPALVHSLKNKTARSPDVAIAILGRIGPDAKEAVPVLTKTLQSESPGTRIRAALGLWRIEKNTGAVAVLATLLDSDDDNMASLAAQALGEIGPDARTALPKLRNAVLSKEEGHFFLQLEAREAIKKIDPEEAKKLGARR